MNKKAIITIIVLIILAFILGGCDKSTWVRSTDIGSVDVPTLCADSGVDVLDASYPDVVDSDLPEYNGCSQ